MAYEYQACSSSLWFQQIPMDRVLSCLSGQDDQVPHDDRRAASGDHRSAMMRHRSGNERVITLNKLQSIDRTSRRHAASAWRPEANEDNDPVDNLVEKLWINRKPANHAPLTRNMDAHTCRHCASSARRQLEAFSSADATVSPLAGRMSRTRSCTPPSSIMRDNAGRMTAARFERAFAASRSFPSGHGLDADLVAAGLDGLLDVGSDATHQLGEELVLLGDGERQQPVEEPGHGRQVLLERSLPGELEPGGLLEALQIPALDAAPP